MPEGERLSDQLDGWLRSEHPRTIGSLIDVFEEKSFAVLFVLLLALPALPLPTPMRIWGSCSTIASPESSTGR